MTWNKTCEILSGVWKLCKATSVKLDLLLQTFPGFYETKKWKCQCSTSLHRCVVWVNMHVQTSLILSLVAAQRLNHCQPTSLRFKIRFKNWVISFQQVNDSIKCTQSTKPSPAPDVKFLMLQWEQTTQCNEIVIFRLVWDFGGRLFDLFLEPLFGAKKSPFFNPQRVPNQRKNYHNEIPSPDASHANSHKSNMSWSPNRLTVFGHSVSV